MLCQQRLLQVSHTFPVRWSRPRFPQIPTSSRRKLCATNCYRVEDDNVADFGMARNLVVIPVVVIPSRRRCRCRRRCLA